MNLLYLLCRDKSPHPLLTLDKSSVLLKADLHEPLYINAKSRVSIPTGVMLNLPTGYRAELTSYHRLAVDSGVVILNAPAIIPDYFKKEIHVLLMNHSDKIYRLDPGEWIAILSIKEANLLDAVCVSQFDA